jgi:hypothetical protein
LSYLLLPLSWVSLQLAIWPIFTGYDGAFLHPTLTPELSSDHVDYFSPAYRTKCLAKIQLSVGLLSSRAGLEYAYQAGSWLITPDGKLIYVPLQACQALQAIDGLRNGGAARTSRFQGAQACSDCRGLSSLQSTQAEVRWLKAELFQLYEFSQHMRV